MSGRHKGTIRYTRKYSKRRVKGEIKLVELHERSPHHGHGDLRGRVKAGIRFEKGFATYLTKRLGKVRVWHNPWFKVEDDNGVFWCSPDLVVFPSPESDTKEVLVIECKLKTTKAAFRELRTLYIPVLKAYFKESDYTFRAIQVAQNLAHDWRDAIAHDFDELYDSPANSLIWRFWYK